MGKLFEAPRIVGFRKTALFYTIFRGYHFTSKIIFLKDLKKMLSGCVLFKVEEN